MITLQVRLCLFSYELFVPFNYDWKIKPWNPLLFQQYIDIDFVLFSFLLPYKGIPISVFLTNTGSGHGKGNILSTDCSYDIVTNPHFWKDERTLLFHGATKDRVSVSTSSYNLVSLWFLYKLCILMRVKSSHSQRLDGCTFSNWRKKNLSLIVVLCLRWQVTFVGTLWTVSVRNLL